MAHELAACESPDPPCNSLLAMRQPPPYATPVRLPAFACSTFQA